jgi:hypothetical protein
MMHVIRKRKLLVTLALLIWAGAIFAEGARYLIITHDDFFNAIQPLAEWKNKKGVLTKVIKLSEISSPNNEGIHDYIQQAYNTWIPRPEYILLVGSRSLLPYGQTSPCNSDNYYANMTDDFKAELSVGRFPCTTAIQCPVMVNKTLVYERTPWMSDTQWFRKSTFIIRFDTPYDTVGNFVNDLRFIRDTCMVPDGFSVDSLFYRPFYGADSGWHNQGPDSARHVINNLNEGRIFLVYRGESILDWDRPFQGIPNSDLLNNGAKLPVILAGCCFSLFPGISEIDTLTTGEKWLRAGTPQNLKGAVAYIGNVHSTASGYWRIFVNRSLFKSICLDDSLTLGHAFLKAKESLYVNYPTNELYYIECNLLGDPELNLWTAVPQPLLVSKDSVIPTGSQTYIVKVEEQNNQPIANALVCVMMPNDTSVYEYGYTNEYGTIALQINPKDSGYLYVTVTARNHIPYEDSCLVEPILVDATFPNQGHHLARAPNSMELEWTFNANNSIFWQWMNSQAARLLAYVGKGKYPSITKNEEGSAWICCTTGDSLNCYIRGTWNKVNVALADSIGAPALGLSINQDSEDILGALGYVVYMAKSDESGQCIHFCAFDSLGVYYHTILDEGEVYEPSISITPKDLLHIVWRKEDRIYYITTTEGITPGYIRNNGEPNWSDIYPVSTSSNPNTEPASNPATETYGEYVYAAWRGPNANEEFPGDVWRNERRLSNPPGEWERPQNKSETTGNESNYPVMSTDLVTVWQEQINDTNWDIWARFEPAATSQPIFETPRVSNYPHIDGYWDPASVIPTFICNAIWTEQIDTTHYEVKFDQYQYPPEDYDNSYYTVEIGDTNPSPYCIERDGHQQYGSYSVDYSNQGLKYRLPYLNPQYSYLLRAIIYRTGQNNWIEEFYTDSTLTATALFEPNKPETVWFQLPKESYENTEALQEIEKIVGSQALIADLKIYQKEAFDDSGGGGGQSAGSVSLQKPLLYQSFPNPFKFRVNIRFQLPVQSKVALTIYDISGRAVRNLINEVKGPGLQTIAWDGKNDRGRTLALGIYFYRLKTNQFTDCKRTILIK